MILKIKKITIIGSSLFWLLLLSGRWQTPSVVAISAPAVPDQIITQLQDGITIGEINQTYNTTTLRELVAGQNIYLLQTPSGSNIDTLLASMANDSRLIYVEQNYIVKSPEAIWSNDWAWGGQDATPYTNQYALTSINLATAHSYSQGAGVIVAVVDTGVQLDHPALAGHITAVQADFVDGDGIANDEPNGVDDDGDGYIDEATGHGTHVAGIIQLMAPNAQIMPVRALDSEGRGNTFLIAEAILFAVENGATVINLSLGTVEESDLLEDVLEEAAESGVIVVAAAGNLGTTQAMYPAADECALGVTAIGPIDTKSSFASYGDWIALAAPGESIYSPFPGSGYAWWSGTSMATPFVAGQVALLLSYDPSLDIVDAANLLGGTAQSLATANPGLDGLLGAGKIDVFASLYALAQDEIPDSPGLFDDDCSDD